MNAEHTTMSAMRPLQHWRPSIKCKNILWGTFCNSSLKCKNILWNERRTYNNVSNETMATLETEHKM